jgi:hypothetical protein
LASTLLPWAAAITERRIAGPLEDVLQVRLQAEDTPVARRRRLRQTHLVGHYAGAPVRRTFRNTQHLGDDGVTASTCVSLMDVQEEPFRYWQKCGAPGLSISRPNQ